MGYQSRSLADRAAPGKTGSPRAVITAPGLSEQLLSWQRISWTNRPDWQSSPEVSERLLGWQSSSWSDVSAPRLTQQLLGWRSSSWVDKAVPGLTEKLSSDRAAQQLLGWRSSSWADRSSSWADRSSSWAYRAAPGLTGAAPGLTGAESGPLLGWQGTGCLCPLCSIHAMPRQLSNYCKILSCPVMLIITLKYTHVQYVYAIYFLHILRRPLDYHGKQGIKFERRLPLRKAQAKVGESSGRGRIR